MPSSATILVALLDSAEQLESSLGEAWPTWRDRILVLLSRLDAEGESEALDEDVWTLVEELSDKTAAASVVNGIMEVETAALQTRPVTSLRSIRSVARAEGRSASTMEPAESKDAVMVPVFYATDRALKSNSGDSTEYTSERGHGVSFGIATVGIPPRHRVGRLEGPRLWKLERRADATQHVTLLSVEQESPDRFRERLSASLAAADDRDVLLFVHGYNVGFSDATRRAAQIAYDLKFGGCAAVFSWPSTGNLLGYFTDGGNAEWAFPDFRAFLNELVTGVNARVVHVIAHSMGNRLLLDAMDRFNADALPVGAARLGQVVFAAPDVDAATLARTAKNLSNRAERITVYLSANDLALRVSRRIFGHGRAGGELFVVEGIDTVDASAADTSLIGLRHSYYGSKRSILSDLSALIHSSLHPSRRFDVDAASSEFGSYWIYRT